MPKSIVRHHLNGIVFTTHYRFQWHIMRSPNQAFIYSSWLSVIPMQDLYRYTDRSSPWIPVSCSSVCVCDIVVSSFSAPPFSKHFYFIIFSVLKFLTADGYLPADLFGNLPFYGGLSCMYSIVGIVWMIVCAMYRYNSRLFLYHSFHPCYTTSY